jgi:predicted NBD/HSP70 family sugar kinase
MREVEELLTTEAEVIGLDATRRHRPHGEKLSDLLQKVHGAGRLAMADCDSLESALEAEKLGFDFVGTTLAGYTENRAMSSGPDLELLREMVSCLKIPVIAEGRYSEKWHVQTALRIGAKAVVMGAALNDTPVLTKRYLSAAQQTKGNVAAFDIGGTWLRFGLFSPDWKLISSKKTELPRDQAQRLIWMQERLIDSGAKRAGVGSGGIIDPKSGIVIQAKPIIPYHIGSEFSENTLGIPTIALNDGLATAWGHACLPHFAGKRVATLALGTGVGFGLVDRGRIYMGANGEPPHLNDQFTRGGESIEKILGGASIGNDVSQDEKSKAIEAAKQALQTARSLFHPDEIVVCGGVGLADWLDLGVPKSPFGPDAGLYGAAALALFLPTGLI